MPSTGDPSAAAPVGSAPSLADVLPSVAEVRALFKELGAEPEEDIIGPAGKRLLPVPEAVEVSADAPELGLGPQLEPVSSDYFDDLDALLPLASAALRRVDGGHGVLVLTDLYGATPSNLAARLARLGTPVRRVSALSLPMLLRVMNYADLGLDELPAVAAAGARNGAITDDA